MDIANEFLKDIAPASFDAKKAVFSKLGSMLGDNDLKGVNKSGNIAIFAVNVPGETTAQGPMGNMFIGALLPVTEYKDFISGNSNCSEPDEQGISTITINGQPRGLATNFRRFALLCPPSARDNLIKVKEMLAQRRESLRRRHRLRGRARDVGVLDAQDELAAVMTRKRPRKQSGAGTANMQITSG